jgi:tripartite-type tricarboxylate transporter receptor subunit TctC
VLTLVLTLVLTYKTRNCGNSVQSVSSQFFERFYAVNLLTLSAAPLIGLLLASFAALAAEGDYPSKPINILVAYGPGGQGDTFARLVGEKLSSAYKQSVVVENKPGVAGTVGTRIAAKSKNDGYTLLLGQTGEVAVNRVLIKDLGYDPLKDLIPVVLIGNAPLVLLAPADAPYSSLKEFIALAKSKRGEFNYGSVGAGTPGHLSAVALSLSTGLDMVHVPYKSVGPLFADLMGNRLNLFISSASAAIPQIKGGKLKALAVTTPQRMTSLPQVPSVQEVIGAPFSYTLWGGLFAPAGTPVAVVQSLNKEVNAILAAPDMKARFENDNLNVPQNTPAEFTRYVQAEASKYEQLVRDGNLKVDQ